MATAAGILTGQYKAPRDNTGKYLHQAENKIGMLKNINYLIEITRIPCAEPSPWIIAKTAFQSAPPALLSLGQPGCTDIVKMKLGLSPWHRKGISSVIKGATQPELLAGNKWLYKVGYFTAEKYLWWWMLADVTTEFITTWQSLVYQEQQCQLPGAGTAYGYFGTAVHSEGSPSRAPWNPIKGHPGVVFGAGEITIIPGFEATIGYQIGFQGWPDPTITSPVAMWWYEKDVEGVNDYTVIANPDGNKSLSGGGSWYYRDPGALVPKKYGIWIEVQGPNKMQVVDSSFNIGFTGRKQGNLTFGCHAKPVSWPFPNPLL